MSLGPYIKKIVKNTPDSHQTSPAYCLTFIRWKNRDTINYEESPKLVRDPLVVINDCISVTTSESKSSLTPTVTMHLLAGDINYATAVAPGDFVIVNLVNDEVKARELAIKALNLQPINEYSDGFKGLYKIQKVRRKITVDQNTGIKQYSYTIHAFGFTELNNVIYYNPTAAAAFRENNLLFLTQFASFFTDKATSLGNESNVQDVLVLLVKALLGKGADQDDFTISASQNTHFLIPPSLGKLLGRSGRKKKDEIDKTSSDKNKKPLTVPDIYNFIFGVWGRPNGKASNPKNGFNPNLKPINGSNNFFKTKGKSLQGWKIFGVEDFNQKKIWSILQSYLNGAINEAYTTTRIGPDGRVYPTVIFRQKPFNSDHFDAPKGKRKDLAKQNPPSIPVTRFSSLPRWRVSPDLIYSIDLGKDEVGRINYVQLFGRAVAINADVNQAIQAQNIFFDQKDIERHGLKPAIITSNFDYPQSASLSDLQARKWSYMLFDMLNGMHLKESGTIVCYGIKDPICVGDNIEFDNAIYHIESVSHHMSISRETGKKIFRTTLTVSFGTDIDSDNVRPVYPQMKHTDSYKERLRDYSEEQVLPGFSDTQDILGREKYPGDQRGEEVEIVPEKSFTLKASSKKPKDRAGSLSFRDDGYQDNDNSDKTKKDK